MVLQLRARCSVNKNPQCPGADCTEPLHREKKPVCLPTVMPVIGGGGVEGPAVSPASVRIASGRDMQDTSYGFYPIQKVEGCTQGEGPALPRLSTAGPSKHQPPQGKQSTPVVHPRKACLV